MAVRSANWAYFEPAFAGPSFLHLNTHLDHVSERARVEGSLLIIRKVARLLQRYGEETPVLITGDFNCRPRNPAYRSFVENGFVDTYVAASNEDAGGAHTFHAFKGSSYRDARPHLGPRRIDWILLKDPLSRLRMVSHYFARDHAGERYPSDHYPVLADLAL
jgi:endonuclease/exonuclease/phosphatase family metal-dependent hydrolase